MVTIFFEVTFFPYLHIMRDILWLFSADYNLKMEVACSSEVDTAEGTSNLAYPRLLCFAFNVQHGTLCQRLWLSY
jgi:hypothetical protein